jgi:preprotein translocase subunit SecG
MEFYKLLWTLFNIFLIILLVYILFNTYRKHVNRAALQSQHEEAIINKLDELVELNKRIIDHLSSK